MKFIGDGAVAVFGVPETREDDALRALDAALAELLELSDRRRPDEQSDG